MAQKNKQSRKFWSSRTILGIFILILGIFLSVSFGRRSVNVTPSQTFVSEPVTLYSLSLDFIDETLLPRRILIPNLEIDLEVRRSQVLNGYWEVFGDTASWGEGSGVPGQKGNQVIFAHARKNLFLPLQSIKVDNKIYVLTNSDWFGYKVEEIKEVYPNHTEVIAQTEDETLTLYTCSGFNDSKRLIVVAKRI